MFYKDRVQVLNPMTKRWVKLNTKTGGIIGHKTDNKPYKNVMTVEESNAQPDYIPAELLDKVHLKIDPNYARRKIVCNCGHLAKDHYLKEGCCDKCGCTWYYPNDKWLEKQRRIIALNLKRLEDAKE
jgi:hypothetical protein